MLLIQEGDLIPKRFQEIITVITLQKNIALHETTVIILRPEANVQTREAAVLILTVPRRGFPLEQGAVAVVLTVVVDQVLVVEDNN